MALTVETTVTSESFVAASSLENTVEATAFEIGTIVSATIALSSSTVGDTITVPLGPQAGEVEIDVGSANQPGFTAPWFVEFGGKEIYQTSGDNQWFQADEFLAVDLSKTYTLNGWAKSGDEFGKRFDSANEQSFGVVPYDVDLLEILPEHVQRFAGATDTTLAVALNPGDTQIHLSDASGWSNAVGAAADTRGLAWYGYADSTGHTYADYSYSRNVAMGSGAGLWNAGAVNGNVIALAQSWDGPSLAAGTSVRNADASGSDAQLVLDHQSVPGDWTWTQYAGTFGGVVQNGVGLPGQFRPGTAYLKPAIYANQQGGIDNFVSWRNVSLTQVPSGTTANDLTIPGIDLSTVSGTDQRKALPLMPGSTNYWTGALVEVDSSELYTISALSPYNLNLDTQPLQFASLDIDQKLIHPLHVSKHGAAIDTTLAAPLQPGDTSVLISDANGWSNDPWESADTRALAWYGYSDSTGHTYADYTYTRHVAFDYDHGLWEAGDIESDTDSGAYRISLRSPWSGPALAFGSAIRNASAGPVNNQLLINPTLVPGTESYEFRATIGGGEWQQGQRDELAFRPGTAFIQPVLLATIPWTDVSIGPEQDVATNGPLYFPTSTVDVDDSMQFTLLLDVLAKDWFGGAATVVIDSVTPPEHGTATIVAGPAGRDVIEYHSAADFVGTDVVTYTVRNTADNATASATVAVTTEDVGEDVLLNRLRDLNLAMLNYESATGRFPISGANFFDANGNTFLSWRVHVLPYLGYQSLYDQFNLHEAWDSANNLPLLSQMPDVFRSVGDAVDSTTTRFQTFTGPDAPFESRAPGTEQNGPRIQEFGDGAQNTFLFIESGADAAVPWTQPDDLDFDIVDPLAALGTLTSDTLYATMADGAVVKLDASLDAATIAALVTPQGGELVDAETLQREYVQAHGGVAAVKSYATAFDDQRLREIGIGILNTASATSRYPRNAVEIGTVNAYLSWRVLLLPYLGYGNLYDQFNLNEPWNSPTNLPLAEQMPDLFRSTDASADSSTTRVMTFTYLQSQPQVGMMLATDRVISSGGQGVTPTAVRDGLSNTIGFLEGGADQAAIWTKPDDLPFNFDDPIATLGDLSKGEFKVVLLDATTATLGADIDPTEFTALATLRGFELVDAGSVAMRELHRIGAWENPSTRLNDFKELALGALFYESVFNRYPSNRVDSDGTPLLSWRVLILPFIEQAALYDHFKLDEPWDSPHNLALLEFMPDVFRELGDPFDSVTTRVTTFTGPDAPFEADASQGPRLQQITDGTSNTIMFAETGASHAVPWTKPVDTPFHQNNPFSALGDQGLEFLAARFDGSINTFSSSMTIDELSAWITHQGGEILSDPPTVPNVEGFFVHQTGGDTSLDEFGVDWFDVVLDKAPTSDVIISVAVNNTAVALLDKSTLTFTPENWNIQQRVAIRGIDNQEIDLDQTVEVSVVGPTAYGSQIFEATIRENDRPLVTGDFNGDGWVDRHDLEIWESGYDYYPTSHSALNDGDADGDKKVTGLDFLAWQVNVGTRPKPGDFDIDDKVDAEDLDIWEASYNLNNQADADRDGMTTGLDFLIWQENSTAPTALPSAIPGDFDSSQKVDAEDLVFWSDSYNLSAAADADGDGLTTGLDFLIWQTNTFIPPTLSAGASLHETWQTVDDGEGQGPTVPAEPQLLDNTPQVLTARLIDVAMAYGHSSRSTSDSLPNDDPEVQEDAIDELFADGEFQSPY